MTRMVDRALDSYTPVQGEASRPAIVQRIVQSANGSFLWSEFVMELLKKKNTIDAFLRALDKTPKGTFQFPYLVITFAPYCEYIRTGNTVYISSIARERKG